MEAIAVYCGSSAGVRAAYVEAARHLGAELAQRGISLVYGGGEVGLMGEVADAVLHGGGSAVGVITRHLADKEVAHRGVSQMHVVQTMHERKAMMAELAGGFVALPGGIGTLEELAEVMVWTQLGLHPKPSGILNVAGYYDPLLAMFDTMVREGFLAEEQLHSLVVADDAAELLDRLLSVRVEYIDKWRGHRRRDAAGPAGS